MVQVVSIQVIDDHRVRLGFSDGSLRQVDLEPMLRGPVFEPLRDLDSFRRVFVDPDLGTITWPNGADIAPETLYAESVEVDRIEVMPTVASVEGIGDYRLRIGFTDGVTRRGDLKSELHGPLFEPLCDPEQFRRVYVDAEAGTIVWPNRANLAPEVLHAYEAEQSSG